MNDLISRSALIAHIGDLGIDPEDDTTFLTTGQACAIAHKCIVEMVKEEPAVDAVEVVRCKDCKMCMLWRKPTDTVIGDCRIRKMNSEDEEFCMVGADDFCSHGKKRSGEHD